jgi:transposase, IS6 family
VLWPVRRYCRYGVSYRDIEQMIGERGVSVDHPTIYRWVRTYAPEIEGCGANVRHADKRVGSPRCL